MENINKSIGERIKTIRDTAKLTQAQLGKLLGVEKPTVSKYESGETKVSPETLIKIAQLGNVSLDWLIKGEDPPRQPAQYVNEAREHYGPKDGTIEQIAKLVQGHPETAKDIFNLLIDYYAERGSEKNEEG